MANISTVPAASAVPYGTGAPTASADAPRSHIPFLPLRYTEVYVGIWPLRTPDLPSIAQLLL